MFTENGVVFFSQSVEFHERGKNHKENVAAKIAEVKHELLWSEHNTSVVCTAF